MFVVAVAGEILRKRNGQTFLLKVKREVASSKTTEQRLAKYATLGVTWYVQAVRDAISAGSDLGTLVKSEDSFEDILKKIVTNWDTFSMSEEWVKGALPKF